MTKEKKEREHQLLTIGVKATPTTQPIIDEIDATMKRIFKPLNEAERTIANHLFSVRQVTAQMKQFEGVPAAVPHVLMKSFITLAKEIPESLANRDKITAACKQAEAEVFPLIEKLEEAGHDENCPHCKAMRNGSAELSEFWKDPAIKAALREVN